MMENLSAELLVAILRDCARASPEPLYASSYAQTCGVDRTTLDRHLDELRLKGLLSLTDWVKGKGQGYAITAAGQEIVKRIPAGGPAIQAAIQLAMHQAKAAIPVHPSAPPPSSQEIQEDLSGHPRPTTWSRGEAVRDSLINVPTPVVTWVIIGVNFLVFAVGAALAQGEEIPMTDYLSGNFENHKLDLLYGEMGSVDLRDVIGFGQWWRLLSYCFLHRGIVHLFMNMYFLYSLGPRIESMWGKGRFIFLYALSGVAGGVMVLLFHGAALGASGALCGLFTSLIFWIWLNRVHLGPQFTERFLRNIFVNVGLMVVISLLPFVSAAGHAGGALAGLIVAYPMTFNRFGTPRERWLGLAGMIAVVLVVVAVFLVYRESFRVRPNENVATSQRRVTIPPNSYTEV